MLFKLLEKESERLILEKNVEEIIGEEFFSISEKYLQIKTNKF